MLGGTRITYLGHATFRIVTPGDEQIIIDPFLTNNPTTPEELKRVGELDTILITHGHFDHFDDVEALAGQTGAVTISNFEIMSYLQGQGVETAQPIMKGGTAQVGGIKVTATNAFHGSSIALDDGSYIYAGEPMGYVIEFESGFRLYHAGDTALFGDMQLIGELYNPDLALLPIGDRVTMGPLEAAHAARLLGVDHVVPMHYSTDVMPIFTGTPEKFKEHLDEISPSTTMHVMEPGDDLAS
ncbi:MAG: metal-dependent hydrolase [Rubrobacter sp.]|jgi:L-ascorbate metabolism protein UlaG (beta-lactamase superfamily)|nr:metal-dependent hydrolase [Rubrobacter sp.]